MLPFLKTKTHRQQFGKYLRWHRIKQHLSLRQAADAIGLSHTFINQIEHGKATITDDTYDRLLQIIPKIDFPADTLTKTFEDLVESTERIALHLEFGRVREVIQDFNATKPFFLYHYLIVDYSLYKMLVFNLDPRLEKTFFEDEFSLLQAIIPLMNDLEKRLYYLAYGAYLLFSGDYPKSHEILKKALSYPHLVKWNSIIHFLLGICLSELNAASSAIKELEHAYQLSIQNNLFIPSVVSRIWIQLVNFRVHYDLEALNFDDAYLFAQKYDLHDFKNIIAFNQLIYFIRLKQYQKGLSVLDILPVSLRTDYYKALCYLHLDEQIKALEITKQALTKNADETMVLYHKGLYCIQTHILKDSLKDHKYEAALKDFFMQSKEEYAMEENHWVYTLYLNYLKQNKRYKDAYHITQSMIHHVITKGS